jgi:septal ring factor EnvC (AmiA/AmiB activator)
MFYTQAEKDSILRKMKRLEYELEQTTTAFANHMKTFDEINENIAQQFANVQKEKANLLSIQTTMRQEIEQLRKENAEINEANKLNFDNLSQIVDGLNKNQQKATELSLKYFEHATRFEQGKPHAEIVSHYIDKEGKLKTELNWNPEFIQNMIKCGFTGKDDNEVIEHWLNSLLYQFREEK